MLNAVNAYGLTSLADMPILATSPNIPGNVALALSVEFPTALGSAYTDSYSTTNTYLGYFDDKKCYRYDTAIALYNTGVDDSGSLLSDGTTDTHWTLTNAPNGYGNGILNVARDNLYLTWGTQPSNTSKSIGLQSSPPQYANYTYSTSFVLPNNLSASSVTVTFTLGHDDNLTSIKVNGADTRISSGNFSFGDSITLNSSNSTFVTGATNTIAITIYNVTGEAGMRVDNMTVSAGGTLLRNTDGNYFIPVSAVTNHTCTGLWSGNFLNWALTQTIDPFRSVLTGGYRSVDKTNKTVLEKAWASGQGGTVVDKAINGNVLVQGATPYNWSNIYIRINGLGNSFAFGNQNYFGGGSNIYGTGSNTNFVSASTVDTLPTVVTSGDINTGQYLYGMDARVKVCDSTIGLENNCVGYGANYKPEGLIQSNSTKLNFAAFGYLNDSSDNPQRDGGVLRAKMAALGSTSANPEWSSTTGIFNPNPDATDANNSSVSNSGVINYLNKFGLTSKSYKTYDPVGELYYTAIRYFKNQGNVAAYTSGLSDAYKDGFPVITNWNDPITNKCQKNFIIGIGDTNTWADADLPGSTIYSYSGKEPNPRPSEITADTSVNVKTATNTVGALEGINNLGLGNLGEIYTPWCCTGNTFFMAGLAYDSHINDIRPDFTGNQSIATYWLDVLESGDRKDFSKSGMRNQFWLSAKYGGFRVNNLAYGTSLLPSQWDANNDGDPDNYFRANNPSLMKSSLTQAFSSIAASVQGSSNAFALTSPVLQSGLLSYATSYNSFGWTGDVIANQVLIDQNGLITVSANPAWSAAAKLETQASGSGWDSNRIIATTNSQASGCSTLSYSAAGTTTTMLQNNCGIPFRLGYLNSIQKTALSSNTGNQLSLLNFLRGDRSNAGSLGSQLYRDRVLILGDIVNSKVVPVGPPNMRYIDSFNPGYSSFASTYANRAPVAYVGANDGMLHAFDGRASGGNELFAYVPNALYLGPNNTPANDGLAQLANTSYIHHYYVDATPEVTDIDFGGGDWHTMLIGGLGKGGKSYFAIDVTNPFSLNNESNLAAAVKWEFSHPLMGYTYDTPLVVKTVKYGWVVVLTSGYNNVDGKGYIFIVNPKTGALLENPIATNVGSTTNDAGLAHVNGFVADARSGMADALYAGDLLGNLWRVDLSRISGTYSALKIASLTSSNGDAQPVTTSPIIEADVSTGKRYVFVGTGKLLDSSDVSNTQSQTFYAINDGTISNFYTTSTLPSGVSFPITRNNMVDNTSTILSGVVTNLAKPMGYFIDLGSNPSNGKPSFINAEMSSAAGTISFIANSIDNSDACNLVGKNLTYALSYGTGQSVLNDSSGNPISNISGTGLGTSLYFVQNTFNDPSNAKQSIIQLVKCDDQGKCAILTPKTSSSKPFTQLNWREVPTSE